jgi:hypothetical protein
MYAHQLDDQSNIKQLASGKIASFTIVERKVSASSAVLTLKVVSTNGLERRGIMRLFKSGSTWFFESITGPSGVDAVPPVNSPDTGVLNTILAEQAEHASLTNSIVKGTYRTVMLGKPKRGYRSVEVPVTFSGAKGQAKVAGRMTCIRKVQAGEPAWFVTGFAQ